MVPLDAPSQGRACAISVAASTMVVSIPDPCKVTALFTTTFDSVHVPGSTLMTSLASARTPGCARAYVMVRHGLASVPLAGTSTPVLAET